MNVLNYAAAAGLTALIVYLMVVGNSILLPLVIAVGASQLARRNVGTPVFGGMIVASFIGIFAIPPLYVSFQAIRERLRPAARPRVKPQPDHRAPEPAGQDAPVKESQPTAAE